MVWPSCWWTYQVLALHLSSSLFISEKHRALPEGSRLLRTVVRLLVDLKALAQFRWAIPLAIQSALTASSLPTWRLLREFYLKLTQEIIMEIAVRCLRCQLVRECISCHNANLLNPWLAKILAGAGCS